MTIISARDASASENAILYSSPALDRTPRTRFVVDNLAILIIICVFHLDNVIFLKSWLKNIFLFLIWDSPNLSYERCAITAERRSKIQESWTAVTFHLCQHFQKYEIPNGNTLKDPKSEIADHPNLTDWPLLPKYQVGQLT